jgi:hypothetical protein
MTETMSVSEVLDKRQNNGKGQIHERQKVEGLYKAACEAGLANGKEEGYRRGYREGFVDCIAFRDLALGAAVPPNALTDASKKTPANRARLGGLPCADCGCPSFSDETKCPRCGVSKTALIGAQPGAAEGLK